jgi:predicted DNA-binding transcriptional regulator AlpA
MKSNLQSGIGDKPATPTPNVRPRVLATPDAAAYCGSSASTFEKLRLSGGGPRFIRITPKRVGYRIEDLDAWLDGKTRLVSTSEREDQRGQS